MEALVLAGGKAERLGDAAGGLPKPLVRVGGRPLAEYQVLRLVGAGVTRVIIGCRAGHEQLFHETLSGLGAEIVAVGEPEPLGRGGGLRFAAAQRTEEGPVFAMNGDEILDVDLRALLDAHRSYACAGTVVVAQVHSPFGVVDLADGDRVTGFREAPKLPHWVNSGVYVLDEEALARLPERGDHETSTFPELAEEGKLYAYRHEGTWLTVNTPKDLRRAEEFLAAHPDWQAAPA
ncbi:MAG: nucleotidyltransferase family protein [Gaiellaceae bacterium]